MLSLSLDEVFLWIGGGLCGHEFSLQERRCIGECFQCMIFGIFSELEAAFMCMNCRHRK